MKIMNTTQLDKIFVELCPLEWPLTWEYVEAANTHLINSFPAIRKLDAGREQMAEAIYNAYHDGADLARSIYSCRTPWAEWRYNQCAVVWYKLADMLVTGQLV